VVDQSWIRSIDFLWVICFGIPLSPTQGHCRLQEIGSALAWFGKSTDYRLHTFGGHRSPRSRWAAIEEADAPKQQQCRKGYNPFIGNGG
jgi:hypothetical protein